MRRLSGNILVVALMLASYVNCFSQDVVTGSLSESVDRYEMLCEICLNLRTRIRQGEDVSRIEAETFINRFLAMNKELKEKEGAMTPLQKEKFVAVTQWFSTGERPSVLDRQKMASRPKTADLPEVIDPFLSDRPSAEHHPESDCLVRHDEVIPTFIPKKKYLMLSLSAPYLSYGLLGGYMSGRWGGYACFRSNDVSYESSYECQSDGFLPTGVRFWPSGDSRRSNLAVTAGVLSWLSGWCTVYAGAGYGWYKTAWEDIDGNWAELSDVSHKGAAVDAGFLFSWNSLSVSVGMTTVAFRSAAATLGLGICF